MKDFNSAVLVTTVILVSLIMINTHQRRSPSQPRGIRNHNPGNIRKSGARWRGAVGDDGAFVIFENELFGLRALYKTLMTYRRKYKIASVHDIINRYAPSTENDTHAYIQHVSEKLNVSPTQRLDTQHYPALMAAIIKHENGVQPYDTETIHSAIALA